MEEEEEGAATPLGEMVRAIVVEACDEPYPTRALVDAWRAIRADEPAFQTAERAARKNLSRTDGIVKAALLALESSDAGLLGAPSCPLAFLRALDEHCDRVRSYNDMPSQVVTTPDGDVWVARTGVRFDHPCRRHQRQIGHPNNWLRHHRIVAAEIDGRTIHINQAGSVTAKRLEEMGAPSEVRVALAYYVVGEQLRGADSDGNAVSVNSKGPFVITGAADEAERCARIVSHLERARQERARVLVLPELMLSELAESKALSWLDKHHDDHELELIVLGSMHIYDKSAGGVVNRVRLLDRDAREILVHDKLVPFGSTDALWEDIAVGARLTVLASPLGLLVTVICRDFCDEAAPIQRLLDEVGPEWALVPAMHHGGMDAFKRPARRLCRAYGAVTLVANQRVFEPSTEEDVLIVDRSTDGLATSTMVDGFAITDLRLE